MDISVILNEPKYEGNIGFVARAMKNFGFDDLYLVNADNLGEIARSRASNAQNILDQAIFIDKLESILDEFDLRVGTTGIRGRSEDRFKRNPFLDPNKLREKISNKKGSCALIFGREDHGLSNEVIKKCEIVLSIPTNSSYPVLNLSHAVSIVLYELSSIKKGENSVANRDELDAVETKLNSIINLINYPDYKKDKTKLMLKRIFGRAILSKREAHTLAGLFGSIEKQLREK